MLMSLVEMLDNGDAIPEGPGETIGGADYTLLTQELQSNVLTPHGLSRAHYILVRFRRDPAKRLDAKFLLGMLARTPFERAMVRNAINELTDLMRPELQARAESWKTAAPADVGQAQHEQLKELRIVSEHEMYWTRRREYATKVQLRQQAVAAGAPGAPPGAPAGSDRFSVNVLLTCAGYEKLGIPAPPNQAFREGMVARGVRLNDPPPSEWDAGYCNGEGKVEVDALLVVAYEPSHDEAVAASQQVRIETLRTVIRTHAEIVREDVGEVLRAKEGGHPIEPFGFRDSISQPVFYASELQRARDKGQVGPKWDARAPLRLALCPDPNGKSQYACGSYFVYRKLEQNIAAFYARSRAAAAAQQQPEDEIRARWIGRRPNGDALDGRHDFDYADDAAGTVCPFTAHVRKVNPRADVRASYHPRDRRIVRRGLPYGARLVRNDDGTPKDGKVTLDGNQTDERVGLLFMCAQSDIEAQFEHIQSAWANKVDHPRGRPSGLDALIGQSHPDERELKKEGSEWGPERAPLVVLRGGEYFFAPSISFLRGLLDDLWLQPLPV